jgi:glycosyltransferase involved in cell wall biosynthesis
MDITVILCTYNRCQSLSKALDSVSASVVPEPTQWEVLVVDNNSSDHTRAVVEGFCQKYPGRFRYLFEGKPGKSNALNAGIRESHSEVLAFMDDDVVVEPAWLQNLTSSLSSGKWTGVGGRIFPQWTSAPPRWLPLHDRYGLAPLAMFDLGSEIGPLQEPPFGTNMAFLRNVFRKYNGFRTDLGPRPGSEIRNEDTEFGQRLLDAGEQLLYQPSAVVFHAVPENRLQKQYFLRWWFDKARADVREFGIPADARWVLAGIPLRSLRRFGVAIVRWLPALDSRKRFGAKLKVWGKVGEIVESYRLVHNPAHQHSLSQPTDSKRSS